MTDKLIAAAAGLDIPVEANAGPGGAPGMRIWARWPRNRSEVAHDVLQRVVARYPDASFAFEARAASWRASIGGWSYLGEFEDAVATLALYAMSPTRREALPRAMDQIRPGSATAPAPGIPPRSAS